MRYVNCMGELYRLSDRNYQRVLKHLAKGGAQDILEQVRKRLGNIENLTDTSAEQALDLLELEQNRKKS